MTMATAPFCCTSVPSMVILSASLYSVIFGTVGAAEFSSSSPISASFEFKADADVTSKAFGTEDNAVSRSLRLPRQPDDESLDPDQVTVEESDPESASIIGFDYSYDFDYDYLMESGFSGECLEDTFNNYEITYDVIENCSDTSTELEILQAVIIDVGSPGASESEGGIWYGACRGFDDYINVTLEVDVETTGIWDYLRMHIALNGGDATFGSCGVDSFSNSGNYYYDRKLNYDVMVDEPYNITFHYYVPMLCSDFDRDSLLDFSFAIFGQRIVYRYPPLYRRELEYDIEQHCLLGNWTLPIDVPQKPKPTCLPELKGGDLECIIGYGIYVDSANATNVRWLRDPREFRVDETINVDGDGAIWNDACRGNDDTIITDLEFVLFVPAKYDPNRVQFFIATDGGNAETGTCAIGKLDFESVWYFPGDLASDYPSRTRMLEEVVVDLESQSSAGYYITFLYQDIPLKCSDWNGDGFLDVAVLASGLHYQLPQVHREILYASDRFSGGCWQDREIRLDIVVPFYPLPNCLQDSNYEQGSISCEPSINMNLVEIGNLTVHEEVYKNEGDAWVGACVYVDDYATVSFDAVFNVSGTIDPTIPMLLGMYVALEGGDALNGFCAKGTVVNVTYYGLGDTGGDGGVILDPNTPTRKLLEGDYISGNYGMNITFRFEEIQLQCSDSNGDDLLDFAVSVGLGRDQEVIQGIIQYPELGCWQNHGVTLSIQVDSYSNLEPTLTPVLEPTVAPVLEPTISPVLEPTVAPVLEPTIAPVLQPTLAPVLEPTMAPVLEPTIAPVLEPTMAPIIQPTLAPVPEPTMAPVLEPTMSPVIEPTMAPVLQPTMAPVLQPTMAPVIEPTMAPVIEPTMAPVLEPTMAPVIEPTMAPVLQPTLAPVPDPTMAPVLEPTMSPVIEPTMAPVLEPTMAPVIEPTMAPVLQPTVAPVLEPTMSPEIEPTMNPMGSLTKNPTGSPTLNPTQSPTGNPTGSPTMNPNPHPTHNPTMNPIPKPTDNPIDNPTLSPVVVDSDGDGLSDLYELEANPHVTNPELPDTDGDGLTDSEEEYYGTDPNNADTDGDGLQDGYEVNTSKTDPLRRQPTNSPTKKPTNKPSPTPSLSPSTRPSSSPTLFPSSQPSFILQTVRIPGSISTNKDICSLSGAELQAFTVAALETIVNFACPGRDTCIAAITTVCGEKETRRELTSYSSRQLQVQNWQVEYLVTDYFVCQRAACSSPSDIAKVAAIVDTVTANMNGSMGSGQFRETLSIKIIQSPTLDDSLVECFMVWGVVGTAETEIGGSGLGTGVFYPDWVYHSGTCLQDGKEPAYMKNSSTWLFSSLEDCCSRFYSGWNQNKCMNPNGSGLWYVSHINGKCVTDCEVGNGETCGGFANLLDFDLYSNPRSCCESELFYRFIEFCEADSLLNECYAGTGLFYRGDDAGSKVCVRDCDPIRSGDPTCGGLVEESYVVLHETAEACCFSEYLWMDVQLCAARSTMTPFGKFWPDKTNGKCLKDYEMPTEQLDVQIFGSMTECCAHGLPWLTKHDCFFASGIDSEELAGTNKFYVDWVKLKCVKDCDGPSPCGGLAEPWNTLFEFSHDCCTRLALTDPEEDCVLS